ERPLVLDGVGDGLLGLDLVRRLDDPDVRERADAGDVLEAHLTVAVLADRDAGVCADELHIGVRVGDRDADRLEAAHDEAGERARERDAPGECEPGADSDHVRLGDAHVERPLRIFLGKIHGHGRLRQVGVDRDDPLVLGPEIEQGFPEGGAAGLGRHHFFSSAVSSSTIARVAVSVFKYSCQALSVIPSTSRIALIASAGFGALPCHSGSFSMNDTPLPLTVCATMKVGTPVVASAWSSAFVICPMSWPSISTTGQPNDCHLAVTGSISSTFFA